MVFGFNFNKKNNPQKRTPEEEARYLKAKKTRQGNYEPQKDLYASHRSDKDRPKKEQPHFGDLDLIPLDAKEEQGFVEGGGFTPLHKGLNLEDLDTHSGWESFGENIDDKAEENSNEHFPQEFEESFDEYLAEIAHFNELHSQAEDLNKMDEGIIYSLLEADSQEAEKIPSIKRNRSASVEKSRYDANHKKTQAEFLSGYDTFLEKKYPGLHDKFELLDLQERLMTMRNMFFSKKMRNKGKSSGGRIFTTHPEAQALRDLKWSEHEIAKYKSSKKQNIEPTKIKAYMDEQNRNRNDEIIDDGIEAEEYKKFRKSLLDDDTKAA